MSTLLEGNPLSQDDIEVLQLATELDQPIHDMPPAATALLAERGIFTTTEPGDPGSQIEYFADLRNRRALGKIATQTITMFSGIPEYAESAREGKLGSHLADVFGQVTAISAQDVHIEDPVEDETGKVVNGIVTASWMSLSVPTREAAQDLASSLQGLMRSHRPEDNFTVQTDYDENTAEHQVSIAGINEHHIRSLGRAVGALLAVEDRVEGFELPEDKQPLVTWLERGETFPPEYLSRLETANAGYQQLKLRLSATYRDYKDLEPKIHSDLVGTDAAAAFQGMREIMNGLIWEVRGGSHKNLEQHPDKEARLMMEDNVTLKRDPVRPEDILTGPPTSRDLTIREKAVAMASDWLQDARHDPYHAMLDLFGAGLSGLADAGITVLHFLPRAKDTWHKLQYDRQSWRDQKQAAADSHQQLHRQIKNWILSARMDISRAEHPEPYIPRPHVGKD